MARDEWSVYLRATDRANVNVQLDLWTMKIYYEAPGTGGRLVLAPVVSADPSRLGGWSAREVLYASGRFTQTGVSTWSEVNQHGPHAFREIGRDEWSVYLVATDRADVYVQLDLWTLQVKYRGPGNPSCPDCTLLPAPPQVPPSGPGLPPIRDAGKPQGRGGR